MERLFFCVCGTASSGSVRGSIDGFKSAREREQTKPKEEREEMREGRREKAGSKQIKRRDFIRVYWLQAASVTSLPPWLEAHRRGGGGGGGRERHPPSELFFHRKH